LTLSFHERLFLAESRHGNGTAGLEITAMLSSDK
jgi:hypothetical protein